MGGSDHAWRDRLEVQDMQAAAGLTAVRRHDSRRHLMRLSKQNIGNTP